MISTQECGCIGNAYGESHQGALTAEYKLNEITEALKKLEAPLCIISPPILPFDKDVKYYYV